MNLNGKPEMANSMWTHFCTVKETVMDTNKGSECSWCSAEEKTEVAYQGLYWAYPLQKYLRWPEYMQYYFWLDKKSS